VAADIGGVWAPNPLCRLTLAASPGGEDDTLNGVTEPGAANSARDQTRPGPAVVVTAGGAIVRHGPAFAPRR